MNNMVFELSSNALGSRHGVISVLCYLLCINFYTVVGQLQQSGPLINTSGSNPQNGQIFFNNNQTTIPKMNASAVKLYNDLFASYNNKVRPIKGDNSNKQIDVNIGFLMSMVEKLNEQDQMLTSHGYMTIAWLDEFLTWNPAEYGGTDVIIVPAEDVWLPEITPTNSVVGATELKSMNQDTRVRIHKSGSVLWIPPLTWETACTVDVYLFPYDRQSCEIHYANWMYGADLLNFTTVEKLDTTQLAKSQGWNLTGTKIWTEQQINQFGLVIPSIKLRLDLKRDPRFFELNVLIPTLILAFLVIPMFMLPVDAGEKVGLGMTIMLAYSIFLLMLMDVTPRTGTTPQITILILSCTAVAGISIFMSVLIINLHHHSPDIPVPHWVKRLIIVKLGNLLCCMNYKKPKTEKEELEKEVHVSVIKTDETWKEKTMIDVDDVSHGLNKVIKYLKFFKSAKIDDDEASENQDDWNKLARVLDRLMLCLYTLFFISVLVSFISLKISS